MGPVGLETGLAQAVQDKFVAGDHAKVPLPDPLKVMLEPGQIVASDPA